MFEIIKLHLTNKQHATTMLLLVFFAIILLLTTGQLVLGKSGTIHLQMFYLGKFLGFLGPLFVLSRGRNGEGKFFSRLPLSRFEVFFGKLIYLMIVYLIITLVLCAGIWTIAGVLKLISPSLQFTGMPTFHSLFQDAAAFIKTMPLFLLLAALSLWLQKWTSSNMANLLVVLGVLFVFGLLPVVTALSLQHYSITIPFNDITDFLNTYKTPLITAMELGLFFGAMGLYRLRHFRNY
ncbi:MAG: hypothetical protein GXO69_05335 [Acidobacteria bacterium]|nr:hypothetical protein [Acidobacteriota bacterium]